MATLVLIDEKRMCLSAAGLFKVGVHLIPAVSLLRRIFFEHFILFCFIRLAVGRCCGDVYGHPP